MKDILCAFRESESGILDEIYAFGREHAWRIELCGWQLPPGWALEHMTDLAQLHCERELPVIDGPEIIALDQRHRADVLAFHSPPAAQGGTGAVLVLLEKR